VPAAIMSVAAANLFTGNIYREFFARDATPAQETRVAQLVPLLVKVGALLFVRALSNRPGGHALACRAGLPAGNVPAWRRSRRSRPGTAERTRWLPRACTA
jgi:Na+/proline symporter